MNLIPCHSLSKKTLPGLLTAILTLLPILTNPLGLAAGPDAASSADPMTAEPFCGIWTLPGGGHLKIRPDGVAERAADRGTWRKASGSGANYEIKWPGQSTDFVKLSKDAQSLSGFSEALKDKKRTPFEALLKTAEIHDAKAAPAKKVEPQDPASDPAAAEKSIDPIVGLWRWDTGYDVQFKPDGTSIWRDGTRNGTWKRIPGKVPKYEMVWSFPPAWKETDYGTISPDGTKLRGYRNNKTRSQWSASRLP